MPAPKKRALDVAAQPLVKEPEKKRRAVDLVDAGGNAPYSSLDKHKPGPGDRHNTCFVTWSHSDKPNVRRPSTTTKQEFARFIAEAWDDIASSNTPELAIIVFKEHHKSGEPHYHAVLRTPTKTGHWHELEEAMKKKRLLCHVTCSSSKQAGDNMLRYLMCYTQEKSVLKCYGA